MSTTITRILSFDQYRTMGDDAVARGFYRNDSRVFTPGMAWYQPWYYDPTGMLPPDAHKMFESSEEGEQREFLSVHYWRDWATKRPPICVVCPNGETWEIDRKSNNGTGWVVTGELPNICCSPSIVVDGYHGFLGSNGARPGQFTPDIDGRGAAGIVRQVA